LKTAVAQVIALSRSEMILVQSRMGISGYPTVRLKSPPKRKQ
jgi:hypothetical protein